MYIERAFMYINTYKNTINHNYPDTQFRNIANNCLSLTTEDVDLNEGVGIIHFALA